VGRSNKAMRYILATVLVLGLAYFLVTGVWHQKPPIVKNTPMSMKLTSTAFADGQPIPDKYTCAGQGARPVFSFEGIPARAETLALIFDDPDAPSGTFVHWFLWNIPATVGRLGDAIPAGAIEGITSSGSSEYVPPCPPSGTHRYVAHLYALDTVLDIPASSSVQTLTAATSGHVLGSTTLTGTVSK